MSSEEGDTREIIKVGSRKSEVCQSIKSQLPTQLTSPIDFLPFALLSLYAACSHSNEICCWLSTEAFSHIEI